MGVTDTVNIMVNNAYGSINLQNKISGGIMKKAMDYTAMVNSKILEGLPDIQSLAPAGEVGSNIDVYA